MNDWSDDVTLIGTGGFTKDDYGNQIPKEDKTTVMASTKPIAMGVSFTQPRKLAFVQKLNSLSTRLNTTANLPLIIVVFVIPLFALINAMMMNLKSTLKGR